MIFRKYAGLAGIALLLAAVGLLYPRAEADPTVKTASLLPSPSSSATPAGDKGESTSFRFGIEAANLERSRHRIERGETFTEILAPYDVPYAQIMELAKAARDVFDVRDLRPGRAYLLFTDAQGTPRYFVYEQDAVRYVVFDLGRPGAVRAEKRPVEVVRRAASGTITSSLYQTLAEAGASPELAFRLSRVFAWQVDFYRIRKGDRFKVVYQERRVSGEPVGIGKILAARFDHRDETYYGFYFEQDGRGEYFDEHGESLRKALLKAPLQFTRISSRYTKRRFHPVQKRWKAHLGTDYAAPTGTPVYSVGDGTVLEAGYSRYNGNWVKIRHNATYTTGYLHFSGIAEGIAPGARVEQGQVIGYVGSTGLATGPHVCYRFWKNGRQVDPYKQELPPSEPVDPAHWMAFSGVKSQMMPLVSAPSETPKQPPLKLAHRLPGRRSLTGFLLPLSPGSLAGPAARR